MNREEFVENQKRCCKENDAPFFMPMSGRCYYCGSDIVIELINKGYDGTELVTGCPICYHSYCE